ncbi:hypothetical protein PLUTO_00370 [Luteibacter phage vB_LflM-Pluto]|uniref:Uncharacterized protein n=1 Tax=Luteibacter phage vB_LflM-Pluto TaxID=2948611 RepID=A0A9E7MTE0_9CAUD|nr:hypothetical protein PLUTO_00370 [Luteibacter phage vB_LflM-Pluto]
MNATIALLAAKNIVRISEAQSALAILKLDAGPERWVVASTLDSSRALTFHLRLSMAETSTPAPFSKSEAEDMAILINDAPGPFELLEDEVCTAMPAIEWWEKRLAEYEEADKQFTAIGL